MFDVCGRIQYFMKMRGWSPYKLSFLTDLNRSTVVNWEGKKGYLPTIRSLERICDAFEISLEEFFADPTTELPSPKDMDKEMYNFWHQLSLHEKKVLISNMKCMIDARVQK